MDIDEVRLMAWFEKLQLEMPELCLMMKSLCGSVDVLSAPASSQPPAPLCQVTDAHDLTADLPGSAERDVESERKDQKEEYRGWIKASS